MNQGNKGPYSFGKKVYNHRGHTVTSIVNSPEFDNLIQNIQTAYKYDVAYLSAGLKQRPDLIATEYYGSPANWWLLLFVNNIKDPFEELPELKRLIFPKIK
jgi:hypothetical protein